MTPGCAVAVGGSASGRGPAHSSAACRQVLGFCGSGVAAAAVTSGCTVGGVVKLYSPVSGSCCCTPAFTVSCRAACASFLMRCSRNRRIAFGARSWALPTKPPTAEAPRPSVSPIAMPGTMLRTAPLTRSSRLGSTTNSGGTGTPSACSKLPGPAWLLSSSKPDTASLKPACPPQRTPRSRICFIPGDRNGTRLRPSPVTRLTPAPNAPPPGTRAANALAEIDAGSSVNTPR